MAKRMRAIMRATIKLDILERDNRGAEDSTEFHGFK
jgi:hypothetical protein